MSTSNVISRLALVGLGALGLAAAAPGVHVNAQDYERYGGGGDGEVTVYAPRHMESDRFSHAPISVEREARAVYYGDLDLSSRQGAYILRERIIRTAERLCTDIANEPGNTDEDNPNECIRVSVLRALDDTPIPDGLRYEVSNVDYLTGPRPY